MIVNYSVVWPGRLFFYIHTFVSSVSFFTSFIADCRSESVRIDEETLASVASQLPNTGDLFAMIARQAQENAIAQELLSSLKTEGIQPQQHS